LAFWKKLSALTHPHLLGLFESGSCQLDGSPHLYFVMEYAEQTLAQLLQHRAVTDAEAREMLPPILDALAVLHSQNLVQGQLKPANILVVGNQLKLASDTIYRVGDSTVGTAPPSIYDPPEARPGSASTAGDIWALGVSLYEALAHRPPQTLGASRKAAVLPPDFSPAFRKIVARCLSTSPQNRPNVAEFMAWLGGQTAASTRAAIAKPAARVSEPKIPEPTAPTVARAQLTPEAEPPSPVRAQPLKSRVLLAPALGALVVLVLGWTGIRAFITHRAAAHSAAAPVVVEMQVPAPSISEAAPAVPPVALHEAMPDVPQNVLQSIHGHVVIGVRVIVEQDGSVFAALEDRTSASKHLQRLAIEAAKEWMFPPSDTASRRLMQIRFDIARDGTTASASPLD
jgi:serine/threonine-protein kinase